MQEYTDKLTNQSKKSISDFVFYNCGIEQCESDHKYGPKAREYHFIHFIIDGEGTLEINNINYSIKKTSYLSYLLVKFQLIRLVINIHGHIAG